MEYLIYLWAFSLGRKKWNVEIMIGQLTTITNKDRLCALPGPGAPIDINEMSIIANG
jgi:hypothetical protein